MTDIVPVDGEAAAHSTSRIAALSALGVVYGDIGTSPLHALKTAVAAPQGGTGAPGEAVIGVVLLISWTLILIVAVKYATLILRADNRGDGGIVALLALLKAREAPPRSGERELHWRGRAFLLSNDQLPKARRVVLKVETIRPEFQSGDAV